MLAFAELATVVVLSPDVAVLPSDVVIAEVLSLVVVLPSSDEVAIVGIVSPDRVVVLTSVVVVLSSDEVMLGKAPLSDVVAIVVVVS
jgi:hypothetical protein